MRCSLGPPTGSRKTLVYEWIDRGLIDGFLNLFGRAVAGVGSALRNFIDKPVINQFFGDGTASLVQGTGRGMRPIQTGRVQQYMLVSLIVLLMLAGLAYYFLTQGLDVPSSVGCESRSGFAQASALLFELENGMNFIATHLLSLILFTPAVSAVVLLFLPAQASRLLRWFALVASLIPFGLSILLWVRFSPDGAAFQFQEQYTWYAAINSSLHLGVDGLSLTMVVLTTLLTPLAILASFGITDRVKAYMMLFLFLETGMLGSVPGSRPLAFLRLLGNRTGSDVLPDQPVGKREQGLCIAEIHDLHNGGLPGLVVGHSALGGAVWYLRPGHHHRQMDICRRPVAGISCSNCEGSCLLGFCDCLRGQSPDLAIPHLAAGCTHGSPNGRLHDIGRRAAETGRLRLPEVGAAALPRGGQAFCRCACAAGDRGDRLWCVCLLRAGRFQEAGRLLFREPHGIRRPGHRGSCAGVGHRGCAHRPRRRHPADVQSWLVCGGHVLPGRRAV